MLTLDTACQYTKFDNTNFSCSKNMIQDWVLKKFKMFHVTVTTPFQGCFIIRGLGIAAVNLITKHEVTNSMVTKYKRRYKVSKIG